jgi:hypothetical protein
MDSYRRAIFVADAHREAIGRFIVRTDENYPILWNSNLGCVVAGAAPGMIGPIRLARHRGACCELALPA